MPIAVSIATRSGLSATTVADLARRAEDRGLDALFLAESASDSFVLAQAALAATRTLIVGTAVANARLRHPVAAAMATATLDEWSRGRFRVGLGVSNAAFNETLLGMPPVPAVAFMRDYVARMREVLDPASGGALKTDRPVTHRVPIMLAALQPRMLALAGEIADAVVLSLTTPRTIASMLAHVAAGASGRPAGAAAVRVECVLPCCLDEDHAAARRAGRGVVIGYARHPAAVRLFAARGFATELAGVVAALDRGDIEAAHRVIGDDMVDDFVLVGDLDRCADRVAAYLAAGVDQPALFPLPADGDWHTAIARTIDLATTLLPDHSLLPEKSYTRKVLT